MRCADDIRLKILISDFWGYPAADSDVLPSNPTYTRMSSTRLQAQSIGTETTGGQVPVTIISFSFFICEVSPAGVLQRCREQHIGYRARCVCAALVHVSELQRHASDGGTGC